MVCNWAAASVSERAAVCVCDAPDMVSSAELATPVMLVAISLEPIAASVTLRPISAVVAVCSSTADAITFEISFTCVMMCVTSPMALTAALVSD